MLYYKEYITPSTLLGVWKIEETKEELLTSLIHKEWVSNIYSIKSESRILEILSARLLIKELTGEEKEILYNNTGKPYFADNSSYISISHTKRFVAVAINKEKPIGLDIEQISDKIRRVQSRIIGPKEYVDESHELVHLLLHWSAKEAMFKFLDADSIDFREHLFVNKFVPQQSGIFTTMESRTDSQHRFTAYYKVEKEFVMVCLEEA
ncbi:4'-phosphopantetheinyl transferase superfamily protein [Prevotella sp. 10(H)]|uniref:4'-phosphopantetheinyl transferase family protein n=1 Tax=Prevotella sp. 10(H) TaxID=1158294 RepID=UPI0004A6E422|nr:4'-phosphopantetheinyl transferase superfamily protein [Prevotella sp. 10(H)]